MCFQRINNLTINLSSEAVAIRPVRIVADELREYEAITFPQNPWQGCEIYLRRCAAFGFLNASEQYAVIDILNNDGDIIQDFSVNRSGFKFLKSKLKFRVTQTA